MTRSAGPDRRALATTGLGGRSFEAATRSERISSGDLSDISRTAPPSRPPWPPPPDGHGAFKIKGVRREPGHIVRYLDVHDPMRSASGPSGNAVATTRVTATTPPLPPHRLCHHTVSAARQV